MTWFNKLPRLVQIILLLIPGVNWVVEQCSFCGKMSIGFIARHSIFSELKITAEKREI